MGGFYSLFAYVVSSIIDIFEIILLTYCVCSWFIRDPFNKLMVVLRTIIDPVVDPVRNILDRIPFLQSIPIDFSVLVVFILCNMVQSIL